MNVEKNFSENLKRQLKEKGITQSELAEAIGVTRSAVSIWCLGNGCPRMGKVEKICKYLHISKEDLLLDESYATSENYKQGEADALLLKKIHQLTPRDRKVVEAMIDNFLA